MPRATTRAPSQPRPKEDVARGGSRVSKGLLVAGGLGLGALAITVVALRARAHAQAAPQARTMPNDASGADALGDASVAGDLGGAGGGAPSGSPSGGASSWWSSGGGSNGGQDSGNDGPGGGQGGPPDLSCPPGYTLDASRGVCVKNDSGSSSPQPPMCPPGYAWDGSTCRLVGPANGGDPTSTPSGGGDSSGLPLALGLGAGGLAAGLGLAKLGGDPLGPRGPRSPPGGGGDELGPHAPDVPEPPGKSKASTDEPGADGNTLEARDRAGVDEPRPPGEPPRPSSGESLGGAAEVRAPLRARDEPPSLSEPPSAQIETPVRLRERAPIKSTDAPTSESGGGVLQLERPASLDAARPGDHVAGPRPAGEPPRTPVQPEVDTALLSPEAVRVPRPLAPPRDDHVPSPTEGAGRASPDAVDFVAGPRPLGEAGSVARAAEDVSLLTRAGRVARGAGKLATLAGDALFVGQSVQLVAEGTPSLVAGARAVATGGADLTPEQAQKILNDTDRTAKEGSNLLTLGFGEIDLADKDKTGRSAVKIGVPDVLGVSNSPTGNLVRANIGLDPKGLFGVAPLPTITLEENHLPSPAQFAAGDKALIESPNPLQKTVGVVVAPAGIVAQAVSTPPSQFVSGAQALGGKVTSSVGSFGDFFTQRGLNPFAHPSSVPVTPATAPAPAPIPDSIRAPAPFIGPPAPAPFVGPPAPAPFIGPPAPNAIPDSIRAPLLPVLGPPAPAPFIGPPAPPPTAATPPKPSPSPFIGPPAPPPRLTPTTPSEHVADLKDKRLQRLALI